MHIMCNVVVDKENVGRPNILMCAETESIARYSFRSARATGTWGLMTTTEVRLLHCMLHILHFFTILLDHFQFRIKFKEKVEGLNWTSVICAMSFWLWLTIWQIYDQDWYCFNLNTPILTKSNIVCKSRTPTIHTLYIQSFLRSPHCQWGEEAVK